MIRRWCLAAALCLLPSFAFAQMGSNPGFGEGGTCAHLAGDVTGSCGNNVIAPGVVTPAMLATGSPNSILATNGSGIWADTTTLPGVVQANITGLGTVTSGAISGIAGINNTPISGSTIAGTTITGTSTTASTTPTTGALIIAGGVGIGKTVHIGGSGWLESLSPSTETTSQLISILAPNTIGGMGVIGAARTSDSSATGADAFGVGGFGVCNDTGSSGRSCWDFYGEEWRFSGTTAQFSQGAEFDIISQDTPVANGPYSIAPNGLTSSIWLSSGKPGVSSLQNASSAIGIVNNGAAYLSGIVFQSTALNGNNGTTGTASAILMPKGDEIDWQEPATGTVVGKIRSDVTAAGSGGGLIFGNGAIFFLGHDGTIGAGISDVASAAHYVDIFPATNAGNAGLTTNAGSLNLASASGFVQVTGNLLVSAPIQPPGYTVSSLPTPTGPAIAIVTDQLTACPAFGGSFTGGGSVKCFAFYNNSAWVGG